MAATRRTCPNSPRPSHRHYDGEGEDPADVDSYIEKAVTYVYGQLDKSWVDCFKLDRDTYNMRFCSCLYTSIVGWAIDDDDPHNGATSFQIPDIMAAFKLKMGISNYAILNSLRKKEEMMVMAQQGQAAADHYDAEQAAEGEQEVVQQPPPPVAQIPQIDGTLSSTPSRSNGSLQADDDQPQGRQTTRTPSGERLTRCQSGRVPALRACKNLK